MKEGNQRNCHWSWKRSPHGSRSVLSWEGRAGWLFLRKRKKMEQGRRCCICSGRMTFVSMVQEGQWQAKWRFSLRLRGSHPPVCMGGQKDVFRWVCAARHAGSFTCRNKIHLIRSERCGICTYSELGIRGWAGDGLWTTVWRPLRCS